MKWNRKSDRRRIKRSHLTQDRLINTIILITNIQTTMVTIDLSPARGTLTLLCNSLSKAEKREPRISCMFIYTFRKSIMKYVFFLPANWLVDAWSCGLPYRTIL